MFDIEDIAYSLSNTVRFTGHAAPKFTVAQHSVMVSKLCDPEDAMEGLLHDSPEAYIADLASPIKHAPGIAEVYLEIEKVLARSIGLAFGVQLTPLPLSVREADALMLRTEIRDCMPFKPYRGEMYSQGLVALGSWNAMDLFLERYKQLEYQKVAA